MNFEKLIKLNKEAGATRRNRGKVTLNINGSDCMIEANPTVKEVLAQYYTEFGSMYREVIADCRVLLKWDDGLWGVCSPLGQHIGEGVTEVRVVHEDLDCPRCLLSGTK